MFKEAKFAHTLLQSFMSTTSLSKEMEQSRERWVHAPSLQH